jgi:GNAT superfamily N-acetyltransferase
VTDGFVLRPAVRGDADAVRAVVFAALREHGLEPDPQGTDRDLDDLPRAYAGGIFDVLLDPSGRVVGSVGVADEGDGVCELRKMYLARECRGRGLGRRLLDHAMLAARGRGFRSMRLETASVLADATRLYLRAGFVPLARPPRSPRCDLLLALDL